MSLKLRRGLSADRTSITPAEGELLYTTDTKLVYIGDGSTAGGNIISGGGGGGGLSQVSDDTSPTLGGSLDVGDHPIISTLGRDINLSADGFTSDINLNGIVSAVTTLTLAPRTTNEASTPATVQVGNVANNRDGNFKIIRQSFSSNPGAGFSFSQHHSTANAVTSSYIRTRGTALAQTAVQTNDRITGFNFLGHDGTNPVLAAGISITVEGVVATNQVQGKITFVTNNGGTISPKAELNAAGTWKVNNIQNFSGSTLTLTATNINTSGKITASTTGNIIPFYYDNQAAFPSATTYHGAIAHSHADGRMYYAHAGSWNALAKLSEVGGAGLGSRTTASATTGVLSNGATGDITITGFKGYILYKVTVSGAAWVRIYTDTASRNADSGRLEGVDPTPGAGVIAEVITTGAQTVLISPGAYGFNNEVSPTTDIQVAVTNKTGSSGTITVDLTIVQLEA